jgi:uncharacterized protein YydD (DUF2326 family)
MCLTDATNLIRPDKTDRKQKASLRTLKRKMETRRKYLQQRIADIDRGLKKINQTLSR